MRQKLDDLHLQGGQRWVVYFPGGKDPRTLLATGEYDATKKAHLMKDARTNQPEWVPGWLVAKPAKR
jgi:hypothetical protein